MRDGTFGATVKSLRGNDLPKHQRYRQAANCKCAKGDEGRRIVKRKGVDRQFCADYEEQEDVICHGITDEESIQALQDFEGAADTIEAEGGVKGREWEF